MQGSNAIKCVLASGNQGKLAELSGTFASLDIELVSQAELDVTEVDETAPTFIENSLIKARHASVSTGLCALADDSGLVVPALQGEPGIRSARYAAMPGAKDTAKPSDQDNIDKLLAVLKPLPSEARAGAEHGVVAHWGWHLQRRQFLFSDRISLQVFPSKRVGNAITKPATTVVCIYWLDASICSLSDLAAALKICVYRTLQSVSYTHLTLPTICSV